VSSPSPGAVPSPHRNGGAALVRALERNGVDTVFGIPGVHNLEIYRHLSASPIRHVAVRHEQGGGYAADGYARASGRPGVCLTTSGPGATNACTAAATAYADSVPVLLCSPGPPLGEERLDLGLLHEMKDQSGHFESLVSASIRPSNPREIGEVVDEVFDGWRRARRRPVHLELPIDVIEGEWEPGGPGSDGAATGAAVERLRAMFEETGAGTAAGAGTEASLDRASEVLGASRRPLLVLGGGARGAAAGTERLAERLGALVVTTVNGKGTVPETHPLSLGASVRLPATRGLFQSADAVVVVGSELGDSDLWGDPVRTEAAVVRIDVDQHQLQKNLGATVAIRMDAATAVHALLGRLGSPAGTGPSHATWAGTAGGVRDALRKEAMVDGAPYEAINRELSRALPETTIVGGDSAQVSYFGTAHFWPMARPGQFLYPTGYATLGYGLPAAIGATFGCPDLPAMVLVGDGGFLFTAQELVTAVEQRVPLPVVIVDNHGYAEIRQGMEARGIAPVAVDRPPVDFAGLSRAFGGHGVAVGSVDELCSRAVEALTAEGPTVISIDVSKGGVG
jgi:thiamine pyrophosphate-dependent acetolactate synthase large subunit-like protein